MSNCLGHFPCNHKTKLDIDNVLGAHPNYPKMRKEILDKARTALRS